MSKPTEHDLNHFVRQGVICNLSHLVSILANGADAPRHLNHDLTELCDQAVELSTPTPDYESAAREAGWRYMEAGEWQRLYVDGCPVAFADGHTADSAEEACEQDDIDPLDDDHVHEPVEFWAVDSRMAELLEDVGERIVRGFAGHNVWARTATGQAIVMDACIEAAWRKLQHDVSTLSRA